MSHLKYTLRTGKYSLAHERFGNELYFADEFEHGTFAMYHLSRAIRRVVILPNVFLFIKGNQGNFSDFSVKKICQLEIKCKRQIKTLC